MFITLVSITSSYMDVFIVGYAIYEIGVNNIITIIISYLTSKALHIIKFTDAHFCIVFPFTNWSPFTKYIILN